MLFIQYVVNVMQHMMVHGGARVVLCCTFKVTTVAHNAMGPRQTCKQALMLHNLMVFIRACMITMVSVLMDGGGAGFEHLRSGPLDMFSSHPNIKYVLTHYY